MAKKKQTDKEEVLLKQGDVVKDDKPKQCIPVWVENREAALLAAYGYTDYSFPYRRRK